MIANIGKLFGGTHLELEQVTHERITRLHAEPVEPDADIAVELDGETPGHLPATFEIVPGRAPPPRLSASAAYSFAVSSQWGLRAVPSNMSETLYFSHCPLAPAGAVRASSALRSASVIGGSP